MNAVCKNIIFLICIVFISACNKDNNSKVTQVAAKVNDTEISLHQINQVLKNTKDVSPENINQLKKQVLDKLIDQQIVVSKALNENLDRTPEVMMAIEASKKDILTRAYLQKLVTSSVVSTDEQVNDYYNEHPELFSNRKIFNLQDIAIVQNKELLTEIQAQINTSGSLQELAGWLKNKNIKFSGGAYTRPAEQIPMEILPKIQKINDGDVNVIVVGNDLHIIKVISSQKAPIALIDATPFIRNYFLNTKGKQIIDNEMKKFRSESKIEYKGEFANMNSNQPTEATKVKPVKDLSSKDSINDKGISGLK